MKYRSLYLTASRYYRGEEELVCAQLNELWCGDEHNPINLSSFSCPFAFIISYFPVLWFVAIISNFRDYYNRFSCSIIEKALLQYVGVNRFVKFDALKGCSRFVRKFWMDASQLLQVIECCCDSENERTSFNVLIVNSTKSFLFCFV